MHNQAGRESVIDPRLNDQRIGLICPVLLLCLHFMGAIVLYMCMILNSFQYDFKIIQTRESGLRYPIKMVDGGSLGLGEHIQNLMLLLVLWRGGKRW